LITLKGHEFNLILCVYEIENLSVQELVDYLGRSGYWSHQERDFNSVETRYFSCNDTSRFGIMEEISDGWW